MNLIQKITADTLQKTNIVLPDGSLFSLTLNFVPMQYGWFIQELIYKTFILRGFAIFTSPNILHQFKNSIPFGLACMTNDNIDPTQQQDFSSGYAKLYTLTAAEVIQWEKTLSG